MGKESTGTRTSTSTEYRQRRGKASRHDAPGTSRQEAGRRSRTEDVRFPLAVRLSELHRLRGCEWVWWRGKGWKRGAGAWKDLCPKLTPPAQVPDTCASLERKETVAAWGVATVLSVLRTMLGTLGILLSRSWGEELAGRCTMYLHGRVQMRDQGCPVSCQCAI
ncbi:hypothetical protein V8C42DRAFT_278295 [Trichoderma barbatum]